MAVTYDDDDDEVQLGGGLFKHRDLNARGMPHTRSSSLFPVYQ
jgi:hypothetical protein